MRPDIPTVMILGNVIETFLSHVIGQAHSSMSVNLPPLSMTVWSEDGLASNTFAIQA